MTELNTPGARNLPWLLFAIFAFFAVAIPYSALNQPGGPVTEAVGIIESSGSEPSDVGPPGVVATVRLTDGTLVQADVVSGVVAPKSHVAHVRIFQRVLSGAQAYEVYRTEPPK